jgi:hypothetical protein
MMGSHNMASRMVSIAIKGGKQKNWGGGGGGGREKNCGDRKVFGRHNHVGIKFGRHLMAMI